MRRRMERPTDVLATTLLGLSVVALAAAGPACVASDATSVDGWRFGSEDEARPDVGGTDTGTPGGGFSDGGGFDSGESDVGAPPPPSPTTFRLRNESKWPLNVTVPSSCNTGGDPWVSLRDEGRPVEFETDCTVCSCDDVRSGACARCKRACPSPRSKVVDPNSSLELTWDGVGHRRTSREGVTCHEEWTPRPGEEITARFCFDPDNQLAAAVKVCRTVTFEYGEAGTVEKVYRGMGKRPPFETQFVLEHVDLTTSLTTPIYVEPPEECTEKVGQWFELSTERKGETVTVDPATNCTECQCSDVRGGGSCSRCAIDCKQPEPLREVETGEKVTWTWKGHLYRERSIGKTTCREQKTPKAGTTFTAEFCWHENETLSSRERCKTKTFAYGQSRRVMVRTQ